MVEDELESVGTSQTSRTGICLRCVVDHFGSGVVEDGGAEPGPADEPEDCGNHSPYLPARSIPEHVYEDMHGLDFSVFAW